MKLFIKKILHYKNPFILYKNKSYIMNLQMEIEEKLNLEAHMKSRIKDKQNKVEEMSGEEYTKSSNEWSKKYRKIDKRNDTYDEVVKNSKGKLTHECHESLHEHIGHGSAKKK